MESPEPMDLLKTAMSYDSALAGFCRGIREQVKDEDAQQLLDGLAAELERDIAIMKDVIEIGYFSK